MHSQASRPIRGPLLAAFAATVVFIAGVLLALSIHAQRQSLEREIRSQARAAVSLFDRQMESRSAAVREALATILDDDSLKALLVAGDGPGLMRAARPHVERLRKVQGITRLHFATANKVTVLRVPAPDGPGDAGALPITPAAAPAEQGAYGIDMDTPGHPALRYVTPWHDAGGLIGYVEVGIGMTPVIGPIAEALGVDVAVYRHGGAGGETKAPLIAHTFAGEPDGLTARIAPLVRPEDGATHRIAFSGRNLHVVSLPLAGTAGGAAGAMVVVRDVTEATDAFRRHLMLAVALCVVAAAVAFILAAKALGTEDRRSVSAGEGSAAPDDGADSASRARSEFLSMMSHELRTPMNAILGFGQLLEYNAREPLTDTQREYVGHILTSGRHLLDLINKVLDLAKIEAGRMELSIQPVSPVAVCAECLGLSETLAAARGVRLIDRTAGQTLPDVRADPMCFKQVVLNLLSNAVQYNREQGTVTVSAESTADGMVHISVADQGPGIPEADRDTLFEPFVRLSTDATQTGGTGIGLTITKQLVELMGGTIGVETEVGEGSTFWFRLPVADPQTPV